MLLYPFKIMAFKFTFLAATYLIKSFRTKLIRAYQTVPHFRYFWYLEYSSTIMSNLAFLGAKSILILMIWSKWIAAPKTMLHALRNINIVRC